MRELALVGNPNTGKTTLFNHLTHSNRHVGNWQGVTIDKSKKECVINGAKTTIVDLPGIYTLRCVSPEEKVTREYIQNNNCNVINIVDIGNLYRNLYLTLQLCERGVPFTLFINKTCNATLDIERLNEITGWGIVVAPADKCSIDTFNAPKHSACSLTYLQDDQFVKLHTYFVTITGRSDIGYFIDSMENNFSDIEEVSRNCLLSMVEGVSPHELIAGLRYDYIDNLLKNCDYRAEVFGYHRIDKVLLNKYLALPIFMCIMAFVFFVTFSSIGQLLSDLMRMGIEKVSIIILSGLPEGWFKELLICVSVGAVGTVISFLPQIAIIFVSLTILENSGYLSRLAFLFDDILSRVGLSGKSIFTLLMGFGCTTTALMGVKTLEGKARLKTTILASFVSCSAKMPLFVLFCNTFFKGRFLVIFLLYIGLILLIVALAYFINLFIKDKTSFVMDFTPMRSIRLKKLILDTLGSCASFLLRVGTITLSMSVIIWGMENFDFSLRFVGVGGESILKKISLCVSPIFTPIGLNNWGITASLISGIFAKEMIVSTMAVINSGALSVSLMGEGVISLDVYQAIIFMILCLSYMSCVSTISVVRKEIGLKNTLLSILFQFCVTYGVCLIIRFIMTLYVHIGVNFIYYLLACSMFVLSVIVAMRGWHKGCGAGRCKGCNKCNKNTY